MRAEVDGLRDNLIELVPARQAAFKFEISSPFFFFFLYV